MVLRRWVSTDSFWRPAGSDVLAGLALHDYWFSKYSFEPGDIVFGINSVLELHLDGGEVGVRLLGSSDKRLWGDRSFIEFLVYVGVGGTGSCAVGTRNAVFHWRGCHWVPAWSSGWSFGTSPVFVVERGAISCVGLCRTRLVGVKHTS